MATLYVTEPGSRIEKEYRHLLVVAEDETTALRIPLADVSHVVLVGQGVGATTPALHALLSAGIGLSLVRSTGELLGRLMPPSGRNLALRRQQYSRGGDPDFCLAFARQIVLGKLQNYHALALRWRRGGEARSEAGRSALGPDVGAGLAPAPPAPAPPAPAPSAPAPPAPAPSAPAPSAPAQGDAAPPSLAQQLDRLASAADAAQIAVDLPALRGVEGAGSKAYFAVYRACLRPDFSFDKRTRRPPRDPVNALLSLGYTLLGEAIAAALEVVGLDPYEGFYHADKYGRPALALDLLEEFRGPVADSVVLTLINKRMLQPGDFTEPQAAAGGGVYLSRPGLRVFLREFSDRLQATFTHPLAGRPLTYQKCLEVQARQAAKVVMGEERVYRPLRVR